MVSRDELIELVETFLARPRAQQADALPALLERLDAGSADEEWNTKFDDSSLFSAWTQTSVAQGAYAANQSVLRPLLSTPGWRAVEIGAGDGRLWAGLLDQAPAGTLVVIDPSEHAHAAVRARVPSHVSFEPIVSGVEAATIPGADAIVCSMTLHHLAGWDAKERTAHGLEGPGKREVLEQMGAALGERGVGILTEANIYCDLGLAPGDPVLVDNLIDSYIRRCAKAMVDDLKRGDTDDAVKDRWCAIIRRWCLGQIEMAHVPVRDRDVYELDTERWLKLLAEAGLAVQSHQCTDDAALFYQYVFRAARR